MKNICIVDYDMSVKGGVEMVTNNIATELSKYYNVHLISIFQKNPQLAYSFGTEVKYSHIFGSYLRLREAREKAKKYFKKYFEDNKIECVVMQGHYAGFITCHKYKNVDLYFCDHGALSNQWNQKAVVFIRWMLAMKSKKVITLTDRSKNDYIKRLHISSNRVERIYNWIDEELEQEYDANSNRIIAVGRLGKEKGFDMLVEAFAIFNKSCKDWKLDIYGDGEMREKVEELIIDYQLGDSIILHGMCDNVMEQYKGHAFLVMPSYREGLPLALLEAKSKKLPLISFDVITGPAEIIRQGVDGILVPTQDIEKLAASMVELATNRELRIRMSEASQENLNLFSKNNILNEWIELFEKNGE